MYNIKYNIYIIIYIYYIIFIIFIITTTVVDTPSFLQPSYTLCADNATFSVMESCSREATKPPESRLVFSRLET